MNSLINKKPLQNNIHRARSSLLSLLVCCFMIISHNAFAQYQSDIEATDSGGGTWGEILRMNVRIEGSRAMFNITSKKGPFYNTNSVTVRSGSNNGPVVVAGKIPPGSEAAKLQLDLDAVPSFPHRFFATITNNIGYAWVGPIQISKNETAITEPVPWDDSQPSNAPQRPIINESPESIAMNTIVNIAVTAGRIHNDNMVRLQCTASNSDNPPSNPYRSDWIYSGDTIRVPLTFHSTGTQAIFCNTLDRYGATSSLSQRIITVTPAERFAVTPPVPRNNFSEPTTPDLSESTPLPPLPAPPDRRRITSTPPPIVEVPDQGSVNTPVSIKLIAGLDPRNRDLVRIGCSAEDSDRTAEKPYQSDWLPPEGEAEGQFTFYSPGEKSIYCTSYGRQGVNSPPARETIHIRFANQPPDAPVISEYPNATYPGRTTYMTVTAGADPDGDQVRIKCSATDSSITGNTPYISDWVAPQSTVTATLAFFTSGNKEITCITIDSKDAQSDTATRNIHVHSSNYNPGYTPDYNFNKRSGGTSNNSGAQNCSCQQQKKAQEEEIDFNQPYIPGYPTPNRPSMYQPPKPQADLSGRVVYRSNGSPAQNAMIKFWDAMSGQSYTAATDYNGEYEFNFIRKDLTGQIQATQGAETSVIREVQIKPDQPAVIDLTIMDRAPVQAQPQWPTRQAAPTQNSVWQFN